MSGASISNAKRHRSWSQSLLSPFTAAVPERLRARLLLLQAQRLDSNIPLLCVVTIANTVAMTIAVLGDLPWWQQLTPPALIVGGGLATLAYTRWRGGEKDAQAAERQLTTTLYLAVAQGLIAGVWAVNAFSETEKYYCMVAPVFIGIAALVNATCLLSVPRAAIAGIIATLLPIVTKMVLFDNMGVRAMAAMMVLVGVMQAGVVLAKFRETVATLAAQDELDRLARSDALTGIANRRAFLNALDERVGQARPFWIMLADLDGFKQINDAHGHAAGDAVLQAVGQRLRAMAGEAALVARLGGDEFAMVVDGETERSVAELHVAALADAATQVVNLSDKRLVVGMSVGVALAPLEGKDRSELLSLADERLYATKRRQRARLHPIQDNAVAASA